MKEDSMFVQEALGYVDPGLLEESERATGKKRRPAPTRVLLAAACICALLVVGAVAAEIAEIWVQVQVGDITFGGTTRWEGIDPEEFQGFGATAPDGFSWSWASEELLAAVADAPDRRYHAFFDSQEELENFLGYTLPDNPVLDMAEESVTGYSLTADPEGEIIAAFASLNIILLEDGGLNGLNGRLSYQIHDPNHEAHLEQWESTDGVLHETPCEGNVYLYLEIFASVNGYYSVYNIETNPAREDYVTPNGLPVVFLREDDSGGRQTCYAIFTLDNIGYMIHCSDGSCTDGESVLRSVLDAYAYE